MWCPGCEEVTVCAARNLLGRGLRDGQRITHEVHTDIRCFQRARECLSCNETWLTVELNEGYLDELVELRNALANVKRHAEEYVEESSQAADALGKLSASLGVLRALAIYEREVP